MRRYLVVANQTLGGEHLAEKVRECVAAGDARFHILVPASSTLQRVVGAQRALARQQLSVRLLAGLPSSMPADLDALVQVEETPYSPLHALKAPPVEQAFDQTFKDEFQAVIKEFALHFREKGSRPGRNPRRYTGFARS